MRSAVKKTLRRQLNFSRRGKLSHFRALGVRFTRPPGATEQPRNQTHSVILVKLGTIHISYLKPHTTPASGRAYWVYSLTMLSRVSTASGVHTAKKSHWRVDVRCLM
jgi:hypothetical protein